MKYFNVLIYPPELTFEALDIVCERTFNFESLLEAQLFGDKIFNRIEEVFYIAIMEISIPEGFSLAFNFPKTICDKKRSDNYSERDWRLK